MPTFDFRCTACKATFDATLPFGSKKKPVCSKCGSRKTEKLLTPPLGIHFKGSGFYKTDSAPPAEKTVKETTPKPEKAESKPKEKDGKSS